MAGTPAESSAGVAFPLETTRAQKSMTTAQEPQASHQPRTSLDIHPWLVRLAPCGEWKCELHIPKARVWNSDLLLEPFSLAATVLGRKKNLCHVAEQKADRV